MSGLLQEILAFGRRPKHPDGVPVFSIQTNLPPVVLRLKKEGECTMDQLSDQLSGIVRYFVVFDSISQVSLRFDQTNLRGEFTKAGSHKVLASFIGESREEGKVYSLDITMIGTAPRLYETLQKLQVPRLIFR